MSKGSSLIAVRRLVSAVAESSLVGSTASRAPGLRSCGSRGLVATQHVPSSQTRAGTHVP